MKNSPQKWGIVHCDYGDSDPIRALNVLIFLFLHDYTNAWIVDHVLPINSRSIAFSAQHTDDIRELSPSTFVYTTGGQPSDRTSFENETESPKTCANLCIYLNICVPCTVLRHLPSYFHVCLILLLLLFLLVSSIWSYWQMNALNVVTKLSGLSIVCQNLYWKWFDFQKIGNKRMKAIKKQL